MIAQIQMRRGTTAEWAAASPVVLAAGEPGYDTTLKRLKIGDGATAWASLPWVDYGTNPNILHNWDFRNPVNQRGVSGSINSGSYFYDRWTRNIGTVFAAAGALTIAGGAVIEQRIEGHYLAGETVTVSVMVGGTVYSGTGIMPTSGTASVTLTGWGTATLGYATGYMYVRLSPTAVSNVVRVKAELGSVSTLVYDPPMDHAAELPKCQRYFQDLGAYPGFQGYVGGETTSAIAYLQLVCAMRIIPTLSFTTGAALCDSLGTVLSTTVGAITMSESGLLRIDLSGTGFSQRHPITGYFGAGSGNTLSADL